MTHAPSPLETITLVVSQMSCDHCRAAITTEVGSLENVDSVDVDLDAKVVTVRGHQLDRASVVAAIDEAGFDVDNTDPR